MSKVQLHSCVIVVLILLVAGGVRSARPIRSEGQTKTDFSSIPMKFGEWEGEQGKFDKITQDALPTASLLMRFYARPYDVSPVGLAIVYGTDLGDFHQPEVCLEGQGLTSISKGTVKIKDGKGGTFDAVSLITEADYRRQAFVFWFYTRGTASTSLGRYKMSILMDRLMARTVRPSAMVRLSTVVTGTEGEAVAQLVEYANSAVPYLSREFDAKTDTSTPEGNK